MGISTKKTTTSGTTNSNSSSTSTPTNPDWVTGGVQDLVNKIGVLGGTDPQSYVAPASGLQNQAFDQASGLKPSGSYEDAIGAVRAANGATTPLSTAANMGRGESLLTGLQDYVNPQLEGVVRTTLDQYDENAGQQAAALQARGAQNKAFGGSRYGMAEGQFAADNQMNRASTESGLLSDAYDKAFGYSNEDAARRQQAASTSAGFAQQSGLANQSSQNDAINRYLTSAGLLSGIGSAQDASERADTALLGDLGGVQRGIEQDQATAPLSLLQAQQQLLSGLPLGLFSGQNTTGTASGTSTNVTQNDPSLLAGIGQGAQTAASLAALFSDRALKRDIVKLSTRDDGLGWYRYNYIWGGGEQEGVMADEVLAVKPHAVSRHASGFLMVDYGAL